MGREKLLRVVGFLWRPSVPQLLRMKHSESLIVIMLIKLVLTVE